MTEMLDDKDIDIDIDKDKDNDKDIDKDKMNKRYVPDMSWKTLKSIQTKLPMSPTLRMNKPSVSPIDKSNVKNYINLNRISIKE